jgi:hypothetical protein
MNVQAAKSLLNFAPWGLFEECGGLAQHTNWVDVEAVIRPEP